MKRLTFFCVCFIIVSLIFAGISNAKIDPKNIIGAWLFNDGQGTIAKDSSGNKNDGTLTNGPTWDKGKFGGALKLDGTKTYVLVKTPPNIPLADTPRTIVGYINDQGSANSWGGILTYGTGDCTGLMSGLGKQNGLTYWGGCKDVQSGLAIPQNEWAFVAATYDQKNVTIWVNDKSAPTAMTGFITPASNLFIGAETINNGTAFRAYFKGLIDAMAILNVALAQADLMTLKDQGLEAALGFTAVSSSGKIASTWADLKIK